MESPGQSSDPFTHLNARVSPVFIFAHMVSEMTRNLYSELIGALE
jgi:hypothetical protein